MYRVPVSGGSRAGVAKRHRQCQGVSHSPLLANTASMWRNGRFSSTCPPSVGWLGALGTVGSINEDQMRGQLQI